MSKTQTVPPIYTEVSGCTTHIEEQRGTTVGFHHGTGHVLRGVFVRMDDNSMVYVETGWPVAACTCGRPELGLDGHHEHCNVTTDRKNHHEVIGHRAIDREEFDRLTGIAQIRHELGWR